MRPMRFLIALITIAAATLSGEMQPIARAAPATASAATKPFTLHVVLYPFIPDFAGYTKALLSGFASQPKDQGVTIDSIDLSDNYYDKDSPKYVGTTTADVYELDSVFLHNFAQGDGVPKVQPLPTQLIEGDNPFLASAVSGAQVGTTWYGVPHWVCSNFLFYRKDDAQLAAARTTSDLLAIWPSQPTDPRTALLLDLKGKSTIGEFYLMADVDRSNAVNDVYENIKAGLDKTLEPDLIALRKYCAVGYCRSKQIHNDDPTYYARNFARRNARAYVYYSEGLHDVLAESALKCSPQDNCPRDSDIAVNPLPLDKKGTTPMVWVDSFAVSSTCTGECLRYAIDFIKYATAERTVLSALLGDTTGVPRYLMPARSSLYSNPSLLAKAHLYPQFWTMIHQAVAPSTLDLNTNLRAFGGTIDSDLGQ
jgi:thiamine pyridinylase